MQFGSSSVAGGSMFAFTLTGSPILLAIALISIFLTIVFVIWTVFRRRRESREAHEMRVIRHATSS